MKGKVNKNIWPRFWPGCFESNHGKLHRYIINCNPFPLLNDFLYLFSDMLNHATNAIG